MTEALKKIENTFSFRMNKETGVKRPSVTLTMLVPTAAGIIEALQSNDEKVISLIEDQVAAVVIGQVRQHVDGDLEYNQEKYEANLQKFTIETIANLPRAERNVVSKDDLESFASKYIELMPEISGKELARVQTAAAMFVEKFNRVKGDDQALQILQQQLALFVEKVDDAIVQEHERTISYLVGKLEELLSVKVSADVL